MHDQLNDNGMSASDLQGLDWRKSRRSSATGNCIQIAKLPSGGVAIRNSRYPSGPVLLFGDAEVRTFLESIKDGELNHLLG
jgi:Domain of unknown function (DUF397)